MCQLCADYQTKLRPLEKALEFSPLDTLARNGIARAIIQLEANKPVCLNEVLSEAGAHVNKQTLNVDRALSGLSKGYLKKLIDEIEDEIAHGQRVTS